MVLTVPLLRPCSSHANMLFPDHILVYTICAGVDGLLPAVAIRAAPPSKVMRASRVIAGRICIPDVVPFCSYGRVEGLKRVALACCMPSTVRAACWELASPVVRHCRPAVHLSCWTLWTQPVNLLVASQLGGMGKSIFCFIACVIPLCQERVLTPYKGWVFGTRFRSTLLCTLWASCRQRHSATRACDPSVTTLLTAPLD